MPKEKPFYVYQSLEEKKDKDGNPRNYTIENLANNQLFFKYPNQFNDPFDSRVYCFFCGTKAKFVNAIQKVDGCSYEKAEAEFDSDISNGLVEKKGDFYYAEYKKLFDKNKIHGDILKEHYPKICCFSSTCKSILMWSHYADSHKGICLRFKSINDGSIKEDDKFYLEFNPSDTTGVCRLVIIELESYRKSKAYINLIPSRSIFYKVTFQKIDYNNNIPEPVNLFDENKNNKMYKFLLNKFTDWHHEEEYRMIIDPDIDKTLLSEEEFGRGLVKYQKEDLESIIFGLKINRNNAQDVYNTIKKHYLDEGIIVNFHKAVEIDREYNIKIEPINDINEYIKSRPELND